jgi:hypothetical protein
VSEGWQAAYVAVSAALGDRVDDALASLAAPLRDLTPAGAAASSRSAASTCRPKAFSC